VLQACCTALATKLYCFDVHEFLLPLVFQDRINYVEEYVEGSVEMQKALLGYLDSFLVHGSDITGNLYRYLT
jgi:hypothetical protein